MWEWGAVSLVPRRKELSAPYGFPAARNIQIRVDALAGALVDFPTHSLGIARVEELSMISVVQY